MEVKEHDEEVGENDVGFGREDKPKLSDSIFLRSEAHKLPEPSNEDVRPFECRNIAVLSTRSDFERFALSAPS
jgi:hypothetical protein